MLLDAGYDDIDFISEITSEELRDINITKKGESRQCLVYAWLQFPVVWESLDCVYKTLCLRAPEAVHERHQ